MKNLQGYLSYINRIVVNKRERVEIFHENREISASFKSFMWAITIHLMVEYLAVP